MAVKLGDLQKRTKSVRVEYQGEEINVEYRINVVTPSFIASNMNPVEQIKEVVADWDILDDDGNHIPPSEIADSLPLALLSKVIEVIVEDMRLEGNEKKG